MLEVERCGEVTQIRMSRVMDGKPLYWVAAYLVDDVLIDSGCEYTKGELLDFLRDKGVTKVVNTHYHEDHIGANALLQKALGVKLYASATALDALRHPPQMMPYEELVWGNPETSVAQPLGLHVITSRRTLHVIPTPGHTTAHVCFFEPMHGWLFTGDLYVTDDMKVCRPDENQWQIVESLKRMRKLGPNVLFSATGSIVPDAADALDRRIAFLENVGQRVHQLHSSGLDPEEIVLKIFGRESSLQQMTQGHYSCVNLVRSFLGCVG